MTRDLTLHPDAWWDGYYNGWRLTDEDVVNAEEILYRGANDADLLRAQWLAGRASPDIPGFDRRNRDG